MSNKLSDALRDKRGRLTTEPDVGEQEGHMGINRRDNHREAMTKHDPEFKAFTEATDEIRRQWNYENPGKQIHEQDIDKEMSNSKTMAESLKGNTLVHDTVKEQWAKNESQQTWPADKYQKPEIQQEMGHQFKGMSNADLLKGGESEAEFNAYFERMQSSVKSKSLDELKEQQSVLASEYKSSHKEDIRVSIKDSTSVEAISARQNNAHESSVYLDEALQAERQNKTQKQGQAM